MTSADESDEEELDRVMRTRSESSASLAATGDDGVELDARTISELLGEAR